jgi:hypothetical protein
VTKAIGVTLYHGLNLFQAWFRVSLNIDFSDGVLMKIRMLKQVQHDNKAQMSGE